MQKVYYRFIEWLIPSSWVLAVWVMTAAIWAASTKTEEFKSWERWSRSHSLDTPVWGSYTVMKVYLKPLWMALIWLGFTGLFQSLAWYNRESIVRFYRWSDEEWWNYDPADAPGNFPAQLVDDDFVHF